MPSPEFLDTTAKPFSSLFFPSPHLLQRLRPPGPHHKAETQWTALSPWQPHVGVMLLLEFGRNLRQAREQG